MWLKIRYSPTTLFSLKNSSATNSAGKSLLSPSPYSVKMALLNAIITYESIEYAKSNFNLVRDLEIRFSLPYSIVVNNCLIRVMKDNDKVSKEAKIDEPFKKSIAFREYVFLNNDIEIAINLNMGKIILPEDVEFLKKWLMHINYFGKKGCFFQFQSIEEVEELDESRFCSIVSEGFKTGIFMQMDDVDKNADFESMNNYNSSKKANRISNVYSFPLSLKKMSKAYSFYEQI
jgi:hypothetical protein